MAHEVIAAVEKEQNLSGWAGKRSNDDTEVRSKRAAYFCYHPETTPETASWLVKRDRAFWRNAQTDADVLAALPDDLRYHGQNETMDPESVAP
jgi:hypothetical protein